MASPPSYSAPVASVLPLVVQLRREREWIQSTAARRRSSFERGGGCAAGAACAWGDPEADWLRMKWLRDSPARQELLSHLVGGRGADHHRVWRWLALRELCVRGEIRS
jgi:hypothetical protein